MHTPFALTPPPRTCSARDRRGLHPFFEMFGAPQRLLPKPLPATPISRTKNVPDEREKEQDAVDPGQSRPDPAHPALWDDETVEVRGMFAWMAALPIDELSDEEAAAAWEEAWRKGERAGSFTSS